MLGDHARHLYHLHGATTVTQLQLRSSVAAGALQTARFRIYEPDFRRFSGLFPHAF